MGGDELALGPPEGEKNPQRDSEISIKAVTEEGPDGAKRTIRALKPRQVQMLAMSGSIGTGLFVRRALSPKHQNPPAR